ncbi:Isoflavone reductase [Paramyrothecium foliicola]|nr:Isoflavone reductase [Paramyrothecium foliicola]
MSSIQKVAIAGASGSLGSQVLEKLISAGDFTVTVLRRNGSKATFPPGTKVVDVDYSSVEAMTSALKGQDAVISTIGAIELDQNLPLIDAAFAAGVKRLIPSEYGPNLDNPEVRKLPVYASKAQIREHIEKKSKFSSTAYTYMCTMAFLDWGLERNILLDMANHKANIIGTGDQLFSAITLASIADALVGVLRNPNETRNRTVRVEDVKISQNTLLALAKKAAPAVVWDVSHLNLEDLVAVANERLAKGLYDMETFLPYIYKGTFGPGMWGSHEATDNRLLGLKGKTEDEVFEIIQSYVK